MLSISLFTLHLIKNAKLLLKKCLTGRSVKAIPKKKEKKERKKVALTAVFQRQTMVTR